MIELKISLNETCSNISSCDCNALTAASITAEIDVVEFDSFYNFVNQKNSDGAYILQPQNLSQIQKEYICDFINPIEEYIKSFVKASYNVGTARQYFKSLALKYNIQRVKSNIQLLTLRQSVR